MEYEQIRDGFMIAWDRSWDGYPISASLCYGKKPEKAKKIFTVRHFGPRDPYSEAYMKKELAVCLEQVVECIRASIYRK